MELLRRPTLLILLIYIFLCWSFCFSSHDEIIVSIDSKGSLVDISDRLNDISSNNFSHEVPVEENNSVRKMEDDNVSFQFPSNYTLPRGNISSTTPGTLLLNMLTKNERDHLDRVLPVWARLVDCWVIGIDRYNTDDSDVIIHQHLGHLPGRIVVVDFDGMGPTWTELVKVGYKEFPQCTHGIVADADFVPILPSSLSISQFSPESSGSSFKQDNSSVFLNKWELDIRCSKHMYTIWSEDGTSRRMDWIYRNIPGVFISRRTHQILNVPPLPDQEVYLTLVNLHIAERTGGYQDRTEGKSKRYIEFLEADLVDFPYDPRSLYYIGYAYFEMFTDLKDSLGEEWRDRGVEGTFDPNIIVSEFLDYSDYHRTNYSDYHRTKTSSESDGSNVNDKSSDYLIREKGVHLGLGGIGRVDVKTSKSTSNTNFNSTSSENPLKSDTSKMKVCSKLNHTLKYTTNNDGIQKASMMLAGRELEVVFIKNNPLLIKFSSLPTLKILSELNSINKDEDIRFLLKLCLELSMRYFTVRIELHRLPIDSITFSHSSLSPFSFSLLSPFDDSGRSVVGNHEEHWFSMLKIAEIYERFYTQPLSDLSLNLTVNYVTPWTLAEWWYNRCVRADVDRGDALFYLGQHYRLAADDILHTVQMKNTSQNHLMTRGYGVSSSILLYGSLFSKPSRSLFQWDLLYSCVFRLELAKSVVSMTHVVLESLSSSNINRDFSLSSNSLFSDSLVFERSHPDLLGLSNTTTVSIDVMSMHTIELRKTMSRMVGLPLVTGSNNLVKSINSTTHSPLFVGKDTAPLSLSLGLMKYTLLLLNSGPTSIGNPLYMNSTFQFKTLDSMLDMYAAQLPFSIEGVDSSVCVGEDEEMKRSLSELLRLRIGQITNFKPSPFIPDSTINSQSFTSTSNSMKRETRVASGGVLISHFKMLFETALHWLDSNQDRLVDECLVVDNDNTSNDIVKTLVDRFIESFKPLEKLLISLKEQNYTTDENARISCRKYRITTSKMARVLRDNVCNITMNNTTSIFDSIFNQMKEIVKHCR